MSVKYPETTLYIEENMKEMCERENLTVGEVFYFGVFGWMVALQCDVCLSLTRKTVVF